MRFSFGANWLRFVDRSFSEERLGAAVRHIAGFAGTSAVSGRSVLDIGSGSGLASLAFIRMGAARVVGFDVDPLSVEAAWTLHRRAGAPAQWLILHGSVLDDAFMQTLGTFDLVYAWGCLHHTGDMWGALERAAARVSPGGVFYAALYDAGMYVDPPVSFWLDVKRRYGAAGLARRRWMEAWYVWRFVLNRRPWAVATLLNAGLRYRRERGMSFMTDVRDWLGGYPTEFATPREVSEFAARRLGLRHERTRTGAGNAEYLFHQPHTAG